MSGPASDRAAAAYAYIARIDEVPGWLHALDAHLLIRAASELERAGVRGDVLEIGVYRGRTALLLGFLPAGGERLVLCDVFDSDGPVGPYNAADNARWYDRPRAQEFLERFRRVHGSEPLLHVVPSSDLGALVPAGSVRLLHLDGAHDYPTVAEDLRLCIRLLVAGGVLVVDDYLKPHLPGVGAATWELLAGTPELEIIGLTDDKIYLAFRSGRAESLREALAAEVCVQEGWRVDRHWIHGVEIPRLIPRPAPGPDWDRA
ncbi:hypothetical protein MLP_18660 [Microlunatus phosphovorus NM-1]|uniref:Methyltransferase n=1 Tax=Microlunatus phosphovorus (strain ATCC 700054 / DSM 10555 / JCM 9379 / NBRC 101784 / NCIMB 13414 / VKM Ac-1990 / NM-1) TaxID=1032480 RepID=F5XT08_MICPN|nr:class I SAM-dependent methyltransferase [Microlunatus phosphovorus]BAK34880.1 hypothetical protein MLP_18660 [Microlunatus phosphovorus NM-1]